MAEPYKNPYSPVVVPDTWKDKTREFGIQIKNLIAEIFKRLSKTVSYTKPASNQTPTDDEMAQARENIGVKGAAVKDITDNSTFTALSSSDTKIPTVRTVRYSYYNDLDQTTGGYALDARQGRQLANRIGTLGNLHTAEQTSLVGAVNEVNDALQPVLVPYNAVAGEDYIVTQTNKITTLESRIITIGTLKIVTVSATVNSAITTSTNLFRVISDYKPTRVIYSCASTIDRNGTVGYRGAGFKLDTDGYITETFSSSWSSGGFSATFIYDTIAFSGG